MNRCVEQGPDELSDREMSNHLSASPTYRPPFHQKTWGEFWYRVWEVGLLILVGYYIWAVELDPFLEKVRPLTILGAWLPAHWIGDHGVLRGAQVIATALLCLWVINWRCSRPRWVFAALPAAFIVVVSLGIETQYFARHQPNFAAAALLVLGLSRLSERSGYNHRRTLAPWLVFLMTYYVLISYTFSACAKISSSGWGWANGSSLMFWVAHYSPATDSWLYSWLVDSWPLAWTLQWLTLIAEAGCAVALFIPRWRPWLGGILVGFHLSIEVLFGYGFYANIFIDFLFLIVFPQLRGYDWTVFDFGRWLVFGGESEVSSRPADESQEGGLYPFAPSPRSGPAESVGASESAPSHWPATTSN